MKKCGWLMAAVMAVGGAFAETTINIKDSGAEQFPVSVEVKGNPAFRRTLERNLTLSGAFRVMANAPLKVTGTTGGQVEVTGGGKRLAMVSKAADDKAARTEARLLSDKMCETYANQKGFANDRIAFVVKKDGSQELCVGYADGGDIRQLTHDRKASVGPRWKDASTIYYTGYLNNVPQVFEIDAVMGRPRLAWGLGGLTTGAAVSPDGSRVAIILSKPFGNPELCVIDPKSGTWTRLTMTKAANEGQPSWGPDGRSIVYVSDESRNPHLYIIDAVTKAKRRLTSTGRQNVDPDWGPDGRIVYTCLRDGQRQIAVVSPAEPGAVKYVTEPGKWEHPTWARDRRHVVAECDGALYLIDTLDRGDGKPVKPVRLFTVDGKCIDPAWSR